MEKGIKGLTIKILAKEMGFSESAIYRHFESKEDIIVLLFNALGESFQERLNEIANRKIPAIEKIECIFESQFRYISQNPYFVVAVLSEDLFFETDKIKEALLQVFNFKTSLITSIIEEGKANNEIRTDIPTENLWHVIIGTFRLQMLKWRFSKFSYDLQAEGRKTIDTITQLIKIQA